MSELGRATQAGFVRACRTHNVVLEERGDRVYCRMGSHWPKRWNVVNRRTARAVYEASATKGATRVMNEETTPPGTVEKKSETLERSKFEDAGGQVLWLRLTKEPKRFGGDPFRIWKLLPEGKEKGSKAGVMHTCADEPAGRKSFKAAVAEAIAGRWKAVPVISGGRRSLTLKPIPTAKKRP